MDGNRYYRTILLLKVKLLLPALQLIHIVNFVLCLESYVSLLSLDGLKDLVLIETNTARTGNLIALDVFCLPPKRLWNVTVLAHRCQDQPVLSNVQLYM